MAAKFYICMLLVALVNSAVYSARLRRPQDKEKTSNFLYGRIFQDDVVQTVCCQGSCDNCADYDPCPRPSFCRDRCSEGTVCCCKDY